MKSHLEVFVFKFLKYMFLYYIKTYKKFFISAKNFTLSKKYF